MFRVTDMPPDQILAPEDGPAAVIVNPRGSAPVCLVCEHASAAIPSSLGALGLADGDRFSHAVWDIGAEALARVLSAQIDAPLVLARFSRLVYDCNRPPERPDAMPSRTETIDIPGNLNLGNLDRAQRTREIYDVFHATLAATINAFGAPPALVTIHSFTPAWFGQARSTELGLLHDDDPALARAMLAAADRSLRTEMNQPYSASDGVTHTLARHATTRGLLNVMIEVRNDLLHDDTGVSRIAAVLERMLALGLRNGADAA